MKNTKVLIIYPSQLYAPAWGRVVAVKPHLMNLFSFLYNHGVNVRLLDLENDLCRPQTPAQIRKFKEKTAKLIAKIDFDIAAISCYTSLNYLSSVQVAELCKKIKRNCKVAVGGYHPSALPLDFMYEQSPFDFIVRGEGELALLDICTGKILPRAKPRLIKGTPINLENSLRLRWKEYGYTDPDRTYYLYLSRGCPFGCVFCSESCKGRSDWRAYSPQEAVGQVKRLINCQNPARISICDACFGLDPKWRKDFLRRLIKTGIDKILGLECRVDMLDKEDIDLLSQLNATVTLGLETASLPMVSILRKAASARNYLKKFLETIDYMNRKETSYIIYLVFNHPGETYATYRETIGFLESMVKSQKSMSGYIIAQNYAFFPGSHTFDHIQDHRQKHGSIIRHPQWWKEGQNHSLLARDISSRFARAKFAPGNFWEKDILRINKAIFKKMSPGIKALWLEIYRKKPVPNMLIPSIFKA